MQIGESVTRKCPACAEEIQEDAKKCKHCGEWIEKPGSKGRTDYQEVKKGIKRVELESTFYNVWIFLGMIIGAVAGVFVGNITSNAIWGWIVGIGICFAIGGAAAKRYYELDEK